MKLKHLHPFLLLGFLFSGDLVAQSIENKHLDVLSYHVYLEPNISEQQIKGNVQIKFKTDPEAEKVVFDSGNLNVTEIKGRDIIAFEQVNGKTIVSFTKNDSFEYEVQIFYEGNPKRGVVFSSSLPQLYTVYFSNEWMICNFSPDDRAIIKIDLLIPDQLISIASGVLIDTLKSDNNKVLYSWNQEYETPAYTYGFAIGAFNEFNANYNNVTFNYYAHNHTPEEIEQIFKFTGDMMSFFEKKSGIPFPQNSYFQILIGNHYQEMSGFSILKNSYGELVLKDSTETNLISHELAHQWWGNMVTCKNWNHFWLNEGFATYMSAAYNEHRFGKEKYQQDINSYFDVYDKIKSNGGDKPLVFTDWSSPTKDDRNLVYFKGAYVLHLLREELGDELFWNGILFFTQKYYGKSVTTEDFQSAMEISANRKLKVFFNKWVY
ncbi:MAG: M1 family aminopeptidase [Bacteroidia bacterium]